MSGEKIVKTNSVSNTTSANYNKIPLTQQSQTNFVSDYISRTSKFYEEISNGNIKQAYKISLQNLEKDLDNISIIRHIKPIIEITNGNTDFYDDVKDDGLIEAYQNHWNRMIDNAKKIPIIKKGLEHLENYNKHCTDFYQNIPEKGIVQSYLDHWNYMFNSLLNFSE